MEAISPFLEFGTAGLMAAALIFVVLKMLKNQSETTKQERDAHSAEIDRILATHEKSITTISDAMTASTDRIVDSQKESTKDLTGEIRALRGDFVEES